MYAEAPETRLLISSSGDGGYHELINGIMSAGRTNLIAGLLPSGNANDHHTAVAGVTVVDDIIAGKSIKRDVLKITSTIGGEPWTRYAHSYVGVGISSSVGRKLTQTDLNPLNEKWLLLTYLLKFTHITVMLDGRKRRLVSLICSNISQMSKVIKVSQGSSTTDGKFEVSLIDFQAKLKVLGLLFKSTTTGLVAKESTAVYTFASIKPLLIQLDGEVYTIDADSKITVRAMKGGLQTII